MKKDLSEKSKAYYGKNYYYELFSKAEDYPELILENLIPMVKGKTVLDAGCGSGKFLGDVQNYAAELIGIDAAEEQLAIAKEKANEKTNLICSDLAELNIKDEYFDIIYTSWVLGTILDLNKRKKVLEELKRVLKKDGIIISIENAAGGEFEKLRGRYPNIKKTEDYNNWLLANGFKIYKKIDTYFDFNDDDEAKDVFKNIYGKEIGRKARKRIEHKVIIYILKRDLI